MNATREQLAKAFNEWMRRAIEHPEQFDREWDALRFADEDRFGEEPSYGRECVAYLEKLVGEIGKEG